MKIITKAILTSALSFTIVSLSFSLALAQFPFTIGGVGGSNAGRGIARDAINNIYVIGSFSGTADFKGSGTTHVPLTSVGFDDVYVAKYNSSGACQWAFDIGSWSDDEGYGITADSVGNVYITGSFRATADFKGTSAGPDTLQPVGSYSDIFIAKYNTSGAYQWAFSIGAPGSSAPNTGYSIGVDATGNVYVTGGFQGTANFCGTSVGNDTLTDHGYYDMFLAKYNSAGAYQWAFGLAAGDYNAGRSLAVDINNNVLVTGFWFTTPSADFKGTAGASNIVAGSGLSDAFVAKYNSAGVNQWGFAIGSPGSFSHVDLISGGGFVGSIATDASGNVLVTGGFNGSPDFKGTSAGPDIVNQGTGDSSDIFVAKYNSSGAYQWAFNIGGAGNADWGNSIAADGAGNVLVTGNFVGTADFKGTSAGPNTVTAAGATDIFVAKYDAAGAFQCAFNIGSSGNSNNGNSIASDKLGNVLVTGSFIGTANFNPLGAKANLTSIGYQDAFVSKYNGCNIYTGCPALSGPDQSICQGVNNAVTLGGAAVNGETYSWVPSIGLSSSSVSQPTANPTVTTVYTLTETATATGCQAANSITVFVGSPPTVPIVSASGATSFCLGGNVTLSSSGGYSTYHWSNGASTQNIKVSTPGNYIVTVTNQSGCSAVSSLTNVIVNSLPAASTGANKTLCPGSTVILGSATINGDTYIWSPATGLSSVTVAEPTADPTATTTYTLTETTTAGCQQSNSVRVIVTTLPITPVITPSGPTTFCSGGSVTLNPGSGYSTYLWSNGSKTQNIKVIAQGSYSVTVTNAPGCSVASASTDVTVTTPTQPAINQKVDTLYCSITASSYQWYLDSTLISGATSIFYLPTQNGNYTVTVVEGECSATSQAFKYASAGINSVPVDGLSLNIYPNPASTYFTAESKTTALQFVTMYDILGKRILSTDVKDSGKKETRINIEGLPPGVYFVQLRTSNAVSTLKLVKE